MDHPHKNIGIILELVKAPDKTWIVAFLMKFFRFTKVSRYLGSVLSNFRFTHPYFDRNLI